MRVTGHQARVTGVGLAMLALAALPSACGSSESSPLTSNSSAKSMGVALITKDSANPFFVTMQKGAAVEAAKYGAHLTVASGKKDGDEAGQIQAVEHAIARGDKGILILPSGPSVEIAMKRARDAGLYVIALDTPPGDLTSVDMTFATDNREAGRLIGAWTAAQLNGRDATIAMLDLATNAVVSVDVDRDQGFLQGMGIDLGDGRKNGDEAATGRYTGGKGGNYTIACHEPTHGAEDGGRTAMETCLIRNPDINVVYTINEPAAVGAQAALMTAGVDDSILVSIDGGCAGVQSVKDGLIGATAQQYPLKMATMGMEAIVNLVEQGKAPFAEGGHNFVSTGVALVTDKPVDGLPSIDTTQAAEICWGKPR